MIVILITIYAVIGLTFIFALALAARSCRQEESDIEPVGFQTKTKFKPVLKVLPPEIELQDQFFRTKRPSTKRD